jgi:hypothetical protein
MTIPLSIDFGAAVAVSLVMIVDGMSNDKNK